jgi:hypothetical protein
MSNAATIALRVKADGTQSVISSLNSLKGAVKSLGGSTMAGASAIGNLMAGGIQRGIGVAKEFAMSTVNEADALGDMISKSGIAADEMQRFSYAAKVGGSSTEAVGTAIKEMQKSLTNGDKVLEGFGVNMGTLKHLSPAEQFRSLMDTLDGLKDPAEKTAFAMAAFKDVSMVSLSDGFKDATAEADKLGVVVRDGAIKSAQDLNDLLDQTKAQMQAAFLEALPAIMEYGAKAIAVIKFIWTSGQEFMSSLFANIALFPQNVGIAIDWISSNWSKLWNNLGSVVIDVSLFIGRQLVDAFKTPFQVIADAFSKLWQGITTGDAAKVFDGASSLVLAPADMMSKQLDNTKANFKQLFIDLAKDAGTTIPEFLSAEITSGAGKALADIEADWQAADARRAGQESFRYNSGNKPGELTKDTKPQFASLALKGSSEAYKTILAATGKGKDDLTKKQLTESQKHTTYLKAIADNIGSGSSVSTYAIG